MKHPIYSAVFCLNPAYAGKVMAVIDANTNYTSNLTNMLRRYNIIAKANLQDLLLEYSLF